MVKAILSTFGRSRTATVVAVLLAAFALASSCRSVGRGPQPPPHTVDGFDLEPLVPKPSIRVGVAVDAKRASLAADSGVAVWLIVPGTRNRVERRVPRATFVLQQGMPPSGARGVRLLETGDVASRAGVIPAQAEESLTLDGAEYRGAFEVRLGAQGVTAINVLGLEDYLRGVVPNELSPKGFPELEAHKAQAIAARTYAIRNKGQFEAQGYDICATPACQVYKGKSTEDPLSDQAVEETRGLVATVEGQPINSLYTSTCGGHTENNENVFAGVPVSYLRGVACSPEKADGEGLIRGRAVVANLDDAAAVRDLALLAALGVSTGRATDTAYTRTPPTAREVAEWTAQAVSAAGRKPCAADDEEVTARRGRVFRYVVDRSCWQERRRLVAPGDSRYLLDLEDSNELSADEQVAAVQLIQEGVLRPAGDNRLRGDSRITRGEFARLLAGVVEKMGAPALVTAEYRATSAGRVSLRRASADSDDSYAVPAGVPLFRRLGGDPIAASRVSLAPGDAVTAVVRGDSVRFLEANQNLLGDASDRSSKYYRWEVRLSPEQVAKAIAADGKVGRVTHIEPTQIGVSGRVVSLLVRGDAGDVTLRGLRIRFALGLRENLFVLDEERTPEGSVSFVFTGKGWGHGVGLCQVGAFGMARGGASASQILKHYYTGVAVTRAY